MTAHILTGAELDILRRMLAGQRGPEIALARGTGWPTVKHQISMLRAKAGVRTLIQLGAWAERHGIREAGAA